MVLLENNSDLIETVEEYRQKVETGLVCGYDLNPETARDLLQDMVVGWLENKVSITGDKSKINNFVDVCYKNRIIDYFRKSSKEVGTEDLNSDETRISSMVHDDREYVRDKVKDAVSSLGCKCESVIRLFYWEDMSLRDISEKLGISNAAVKSRLIFGRKKLRSSLYSLHDKYII